MKKYGDNQKEKEVKPLLEKSGVACDELKCNGEMMIEIPAKRHPELKDLSRSHCGECGWRGWV